MRFLYVIPVLILGWMVFFNKPHQPKIYDCFLFFNELELLEVRLSEMSEHVDKFVIVEAKETFRGKEKPLFFQENRHLFEKYADKIIHVVVEERLKTENPWYRERYQRQQIMRGLKECHKNDIIFLSDVDEIVRGDCIKEIARLIQSNEQQAVVCRQAMYSGFLNRYLTEWSGTVCTSYKEFKRLPVKITRKLRNMTPRTLGKAKISKIVLMENAGWHFNSMGGLARYVTKLESFSHKELDRPDLDKIKHFAETILPLPVVEIDSSFPLYIQKNQEHLKAIGFL